MRTKNIEEIEELPDILSDKNVDAIKTNKNADRYFLISLSLVGLSSIFLFIILIIV